MKVTLDFGVGQTEEVEISETALEAIRHKFNPSALMTVTRLKTLAAAFISECERQGHATPAAREFAVAITNMQTTSMWSVLGATKGL